MHILPRWGIFLAILIVAGFFASIAMEPSNAGDTAKKYFKLEAELKVPETGLNVSRVVDPDTGATCYVITGPTFSISCLKK
jgi:hypothetical protein